MRLETVLFPADNETERAVGGGGIHGRVFGEMYAGSFILDGERVEIRRELDPEYCDPVYLDGVTQSFCGRLYRLWPGERYLASGGGRLHRNVWTAAFGPIPDGCHIHHRDSDPLNNRLENLECVPASEHLSESSRKRICPEDGWVSALAREKAAEWHASPEGRLWHQRHAVSIRSWEKWPREEKPCEHCGKLHMALIRKTGKTAGKFCSRECKKAAYKASGKANEYARNHRARQAAKRDG
jgi:HNH endonuclease